jgi:dienelactone hydrolase
MTRRDLFSTSLFAAGAARPATIPARSADESSFLGTPYHPYPRCLPDYLRALARKAAEKRDAELAKLTTPAAIEARQKWVRATLWKLIGGMPERTPLNARTTASFERDRHKVEKIVYESRPGLFVSANLYTPKSGNGPFPAVLFQSGHYNEGKANPNYQRCCQGLAQLGFVVLAFDPMGQGERIQYPDSSGTHTRLDDVDSEHSVPGKQMLLYGDTATRFQLWDSIRSLDYLASLPIVDAKRMGSTGHSGGGTLTMLLSAADERLSAAAVSMGNFENVAATPFLSPGSTDDAEQDFIDSGPVGFDRCDLMYPFAPKPMLYWPSDRDFYATYSSQYISNGWQEFQKVKKIYAVLGHSDRLKWSDTPLPHSLAYDSRLFIYNWFTRWLKDSTRPVREEPPVNPEAEAELYATESGSVVRSLHSETAFTLNKARKVQRAPARIDALLRVSRRPAPAKVIARAPSPGTTVEVLEIAPEPAIWLPAWVLSAKDTPRDKPVLLALDPVAAERLWFRPDADLAPGSPIICAVDIRGVGALLPEYSPGQGEYAAWHKQEENYAWASLILGKPLLGQRVTDILAVTTALRKHPATTGRRIRLAAAGRLTTPALFAAAIDDAIEALYLSGGLTSFQDIVQSETYTESLANFVPGLLNHTDLPDVAAGIAPRRIILAGSLGPNGQTAGTSGVRQQYTSGNISIEAEANWTVERLIAFAAG